MNSSGNKLKIFVITLLGLIILFIYRDIFYGQFSISKNEEIEKLILEKESELQAIYQENQDLKKEIELLKNNEDHIKKIAEEDLGLIKKDEEKPE
jgi:cell division protein FtsB|tara:strand:+ start:3668 stop:3952 length:285 start_codon:yes stop_codon:yes gene_type:complete